MAYEGLPLSGGEENTNFDVNYTLDGKEYDLRFRYNDRADTWSMSVYDSAGSAIRNGIRCVVNFPLLRKSANPASPPGILFLYDQRTDNEAPALDDLGSTIGMYYIEEGTQVP